ncbi:MAG: CotH kinase family protein, partial [Candidatus Sumerlaeia bacterium]|nr:CotH kinase family protein [Candidatus Sumerlaeia bacterium]
IADEVRYYDGGRWPKWADGGGSSLELTDPRQENDCPTAWADSDETSKSQWTRITYTKPNNNGRAEFQMFLLEAGAVLVDDIELSDGKRNHIANGRFDTDAKGWELGGTHKYSTWVADPDSTGGCLRVEAVGGGTTGVNSIRATLSAALLSTGTYTVSYRARWLAGTPWLCTRVHNNGVAQTNAVPVPDTLGTPGRRNSRYAENTGPLIRDVVHSPAVPTSATPVTVIARVSDPDGVTSAGVRYRLDGAPGGVVIPMWDDGCHGDGAAGDGLYGAVLPAQRAGQLVEYYVQAVDGRGALRNFPPEGPGAAAIYRVQNDGPRRPTAMKQFDLWITTGTLRQLYARSGGGARMDNEFLNATLVVDGRRVFQNIGVRYQGSPYLRPARGGLFGALFVKQQPGYVVRFNDDEKLFGYRRVNFDSQNVDRTGLHERMVAWLAGRFGGIPCNAREYVKLSLNGGPPAIVELLQRIDKRFLEDAFPGAADGDLYETNTAFEWRGSQFTGRAPEFRDHGPDKELYRHTFQKRTNEAADDYTSLIELLRAFDPQQTDDSRLEAALEAVLDVDQWLRTLAVMAVVGDWDGVGFMTNKNGYLYRRPDTGRWVLIPWDKDLTWERTQMQVVNPRLAGISRLMTYPPLKRRYYRCIEELLEGPFTRSEIDPVVDSLHQMLLAEGGDFTSPTAMKRFVDARRKWLQENVVPTTVTFSIVTGGGKDFATSAGKVALEGTAPLRVKTIALNGKPVAVEWTDATRWRLSAVPLAKGENRFELTASPMPADRESKCAITVRRE